jgi:hypothetical protein
MANPPPKKLIKIPYLPNNKITSPSQPSIFRKILNIPEALILLHVPHVCNYKVTPCFTDDGLGKQFSSYIRVNMVLQSQKRKDFQPYKCRTNNF